MNTTQLRTLLESRIGAAILAATASAALMASVALTASSARGAPPAATGDVDLQPNAGRDALRQMVQNHCVVNWSQHHDPAPCARVFLPDSKTANSGYALLADRKGGAHYLLIPTQTMVGLDGGELLDPDAPNYFAEAWHARDLIAKYVGHEVPRSAIGLAINTAHARSQDQFHVHIECVRQDVADALRAGAAGLTDVWAPMKVAGSTYDALRIMGEGLDGSNPFELLATLKPDTRRRMGDYTLVVTGAQFKDGPGFIVLTGTGPTGELLLDSGCSVAGAGG